jgi:hypothetical protein
LAAFWRLAEKYSYFGTFLSNLKGVFVLYLRLRLVRDSHPEGRSASLSLDISLNPATCGIGFTRNFASSQNHASALQFRTVPVIVPKAPQF